MIFEIQKASLLKRFSAFLLDFIFMTVAVTGFAALIGFCTGFEGYFDTYSSKSEYYASAIEIDEAVDFKVDFNIAKENYDKLSEENRKKIDDAYAAFQKDEEVIYAYNMIFNLTLIILTFSMLLGYLLLEFLIPLILGNGQTVGKKVFAIGIIHTNGVKINNIVLFTRALLGKYTIESMVPIIIFLLMIFGGGGIIGLMVLCIILITELFMFFKNKMFTPIHDVIGSTIAVDLPSQKVFNNADELIAYKNALHERIAKEAEY